MRKMGVSTVSDTEMGGSFNFDRRFTSLNGVGGHELASVLLGAPSSGYVPYDDGPFEWFTKYYGAYIQDDWRVNQKLTVNFGVRLEHEDGLREIENRQAVAFDTEVVSPLNAIVPKTGLLAGRTINGGLIFAGVDGAPEEQGDPAAIKIAPRGGFSYSLNKETVLRGGYGLFYAPWNYTRGQHGQAGFTRRHDVEPVGSHDRRADHVVGQPVPGRPDRADRQLTWTAHQHRRARSGSSTRTRATRRCTSTRSTSSASCPATWPSPSATSAPPDATSATSARRQRRPKHQHQPDRSGGGPRGLPGCQR